MANSGGWIIVQGRKKNRKRNQAQSSSNNSNQTEDYNNYSTNLEHQDWNPTTLTKSWNSKNRKKSTVVAKRYNAGTNKQNKDIVDQQKLDQDNENTKVERVSHNLKMQIQKARQSKGWSQKQLANNCNLHVSVIQSYEQGIAIPNNQHLMLMSRRLGVTLRKNN